MICRWLRAVSWMLVALICQELLPRLDLSLEQASSAELPEWATLTMEAISNPKMRTAGIDRNGPAGCRSKHRSVSTRHSPLDNTVFSVYVQAAFQHFADPACGDPDQI